MEKIALSYVFYYVVFPGFIFLAAAGMVMSWVDRKLTARFQWRMGPPFFQPFYDLRKLLLKESFSPQGGNRLLFALSPLLYVISIVIVFDIMVLTYIKPSISFIGDLIVVMYFLTAIPLASILGASASNNAFASLGASREMKSILSYELPLILALLVPVIRSHSIFIGRIIETQTVSGSFAWSISGFIAFIVAMVCVQAKMGLAPFDISEAETELAAGTLIEYSGPLLAVWKLGKMMLMVTAPVFVAIMFLCGGLKILMPLTYLLLMIFFIVLKNINPRVRIDQSIRFFWSIATIAAVTALTLAALGF
jgi:NADH-quinone oxidoreductase subunit H